MTLRQKVQLALPFLPGIVCLPLWAFLMTQKGTWYESFASYYPMSIAMVFGCFIAGSTPLGGAVVAFPVAVLVIKFTPVQGRDFAVLIQSVGMTAAAYLIAMKKRHLVDAWLVQTSCVANTLGVILGFCIDLPGFWVNVSYMTYAVVFAGLLFYKDCVTVPAPAVKSKDAERDGEDLNTETVMATFCLFLSGIIGGVLASKIGSGSDTMAYVFGLFVYNPFFSRPGEQLAESALTASSVVIMGYSTVVVTVIRLVQGDIAERVYHCWGAVLWIVVFGAPIGSYVLSKEREKVFRNLFYFLAAAQFATFAVLKIKGRLAAWFVIGCISVLAVVGVVAHYFLIVRNVGEIDAVEQKGNPEEGNTPQTRSPQTSLSSLEEKSFRYETSVSHTQT